MKTCTTCGETKPVDQFYTNRGRPGSQCKICIRSKVNAYRNANPEEISARKLKYRLENKEAIYLKNKERYEENKEFIRLQQKGYYERNKAAVNSMNRDYYHNNKRKMREVAQAYRSANVDRHNAANAKRRAARKNAIAGWSDLKEIAKIYRKARESGMHVDHIVPLQSELVCGLHVTCNLQLLTASENSEKGNYWWPDMPD